MYKKQTLPQYWQSLCGQASHHSQVIVETNSQTLLIEAIAGFFDDGSIIFTLKIFVLGYR